MYKITVIVYIDKLAHLNCDGHVVYRFIFNGDSTIDVGWYRPFRKRLYLSKQFLKTLLWSWGIGPNPESVVKICEYSYKTKE